MPVIWVAGHGACADDEAFRDGSGDRDLGAELVAHTRLALRDAIDLGFMQAVDLVLVLRLLGQEPPSQHEGIADLLAQRSSWNAAEMTAQVAHDPTCVAFQFFQCLAHPLELFRMGIAAHLPCQAWAKTAVTLAQIDTRFTGQCHQLLARALIKARIGRIGNVLFHHRRVDRHALKALVIHSARRAPSFNGLGQQPFGTFLTNAIAPACER